MAVVKLTFAGDPLLDWESGEATPNHSYASLLLLDDRPHSEQLKAYFPCDNGKDTPLNVVYNELNRTVNISESQILAPCGKTTYNPTADDVVLYRETQLDSSYVTFTDGAKLTAATLNLETDQLLHLIQELDNRFEETNPWWIEFPNFTCELTAVLQCDVTDLLSRMTQEELNVDNLQLWVASGTTNTGTIPHRWNYLTTDDLMLTDGSASIAPYNVYSLFDHSRALHHYVRDLRDDVNWLLGQAPAYDGAYLESVTSVAPCDASGNAGFPLVGCPYVKLTFTMSHGVVHDIIYPAPPHIKAVNTTDGGNDFTLTFTYCDGTTQVVGPITKWEGPTGPAGPNGPKGNNGNGFFCWRTGSLMELGSETPNMSNLPTNYSNVCYFVTYDEPVETNPLKGVAGGLMQELHPQFGGPGNTTTGTGNYSGYILRYTDMGGHFKWVSTDTQWFQGAQVSSSPVKYLWDNSVAGPLMFPPADEGHFMVDSPTDLTAATLLRLPYVDATGNDLTELLTSYTSGTRYHSDDGIGTVILSNEKSPGRSAYFKLESVGTWSNISGEGIDLEVSHLGSSTDFPFDVHGSPIVGRDRICFHFQKHGQVPPNTLSWSQLFYHPTIASDIPQDTNFFDSIVKVPNEWDDMTLKAASIVVDEEIDGVGLGLEPRLQFRLYYQSASRIGTQGLDLWHSGGPTLVATIQSYVGTNEESNNSYVIHADTSGAEEVDLTPPNNGYLFLRSTDHASGGWPDHPQRAILHMEFDGNVLTN